jgi:hypothetical protein
MIERLREEYDVAFRNWAAQVRVLQSIDSGDPLDGGAIEQARRWVEEAAAIYQEKRNLYLNHVIASRSRQSQRVSGKAPSRPNTPAGSSPDPCVSSPEPSPIRKLARQIWEEAGRPAGTAEQDWHRAKEIIQTRR